MTKGERTREAIVSRALKTAAAEGFSGLSLGPLAAELGMSKSGLFAHFASKEALEVAVLDAAIDRFRRAVIAPAMNKPEGLARLRAYFEKYLDWITGAGELSGCPFTVLAQEYAGRPGPVHELLTQSQRSWRGALAAEIKTAAAQEEVRRAGDPAQVAFELIGAALSFQHETKLLKNRKARAHARAAFDRILDPLR